MISKTSQKNITMNYNLENVRIETTVFCWFLAFFDCLGSTANVSCARTVIFLDISQFSLVGSGLELTTSRLKAEYVLAAQKWSSLKYENFSFNPLSTKAFKDQLL